MTSHVIDQPAATVSVLPGAEAQSLAGQQGDTPMADLHNLVHRYLELWNTADPQVRAELADALFATGGGLTDPLVDVTGAAAVSAVVDAVREQFPGHLFRLAGEIDAHHEVARFTWELVPEAGGEPVVVGFDVAEATAEGRLGRVHGFLDKVPA